MSRKSVLNMDYVSDDVRETLIREQAKRKRVKNRIYKLMKDKCNGCWYSAEIQKLLHEL